MKKKILTSVLGVSTLTVVSLSQTNPAQALVFSNGTVGVTSNDIGNSFLVNFDGNVNNQNVSGLSSQANFTLTSFTNNQAVFNILLSNTSSGGISSRTSVLGFDVDPNATSATANGIFNTVVYNGNLPNQFGSIELCAGSNINNCQGGNNGGISTGNAAGLFQMILNFSQPLSSFQLQNFGVRYQSITGTSLGTSGTGKGTPNPIPTPALLPGLVGIGFAALRKKKQAKIAQSI